MLDEINETFGVEPAVVLADAGYCNEPDLLELEKRRHEVCRRTCRSGFPQDKMRDTRHLSLS